jgi:hypothetical protein
MKTTTNAREIKAKQPCTSGYSMFLKAHGDSSPLLSNVLLSNGWEDFWWWIGEFQSNLAPSQLVDLRLLGCDYAQDALHHFAALCPDDTRPANAIAVSRQYAFGNATAEEFDAAWAAAWDDWAAGAAGAAAWAADGAARAAAWAAGAARAAAWAADGDAAGAARAARAAAWAADGDAAWAAAGAARAAAGDARAAAGDAKEKEQTAQLMTLLLKWEAEA